MMQRLRELFRPAAAVGRIRGSRIETRRRFDHAALFAAVALFALSGCSSMRQHVEGLFGESASAETPAATTSRKPEPFYVASDHLPVYAAPSKSSDVQGYLTLHERVLRSKLERGFAFVSRDGGGPEGWIDNAQLLVRLPSGASQKATDAATPPAPTNEAADDAGVNAAPEDEAAARASDGSSAAPGAESAPAAEPTASAPAASAPAASAPAASAPAAAPVPISAPAPAATRPRAAPATFDPF
jgi:hypothetical protein